MGRDEYRQPDVSQGKKIETTFPNSAPFPKTQVGSSSGGEGNISSTGGDGKGTDQPPPVVNRKSRS